jgi:hypothetical protein
MIKSFASKLISGTAFASLTAAMLLAPQHALAGNTTSAGHGIKCYYVVVSSNPATGSQVLARVCRKGGA